MKKLFLQSGKLMVGEFPEEPKWHQFPVSPDGSDYEIRDEQRDEYEAAVSAAMASAVEVVSDNIYEYDGSIFLRLEPHSIAFDKEELHDLPKGWTVEIDWDKPCIPAKKCLIADASNENNCDQIHGHVCQKWSRVARLRPLKSQPSGPQILCNDRYPDGIPSDTVEAGIPESGEDFIQSVENAYMDRITTILIQKWHLDYGTARDVGRDFFYSWILPIYELGGQFGLKPKVSPPPQAEAAPIKAKLTDVNNEASIKKIVGAYD